MLAEQIRVPTIDEVRERFLSRREKLSIDIGFETHEYLPYCGFDWVKDQGLLKEDVQKTDDSIAGFGRMIDRDEIVNNMKGYMSFAFDKANNQRGISSNRSIEHYIAWIWLSGEREYSAEIERMYNKEYQFYGKLILQSICEHYGWDWKQWDDGILSNG